MPQLGFGVYKIDNEDTVNVVKQAIDIGYRSLDTAQFYGNEQGVGAAVAESGVKREDIFITTKVWNSHQGYEKTLQAFEESIKRLDLDYIDLYLIHWPTPMYDNYIETYKALEELYRDGRVKAIGVSNFYIEHLQRVLDECEVVPAVNQIECHPYLQQKELKNFCEDHGIHIESWSPLNRGSVVLEESIIKRMAESHDKTPAQIILKWHIQEDAIVIPKSVTSSRIEENFNVFDFNLSDREMKLITNLNRNERSGPEPNTMDVR